MVLAHERLVGDGEPEQWMLFLHGILGRRANWRSFARKLLAKRPGWGAVLVDLRDHGESQGLSGERTVAAAGADLVGLVSEIERDSARVAGILGHSFGGKVAIAGAAELRASGCPLDELWIIDAPPGPRPETREPLTAQVFAALGGLPDRFASRTAFVEALGAAGISKMTAQWLATNLVGSNESGWVFGLDLAKLRLLIADFLVVDTWPILEVEARLGCAVNLVVAERSDAVSGSERERAEAANAAGTITLHEVPRAGHWVHVENPAGLLEVF